MCLRWPVMCREEACAGGCSDAMLCVGVTGLHMMSQQGLVSVMGHNNVTDIHQQTLAFHPTRLANMCSPCWLKHISFPWVIATNSTCHWHPLYSTDRPANQDVSMPSIPPDWWICICTGQPKQVHWPSTRGSDLN